ncbi:MAG TPA: hypothetical protein VN366_08730 [Feifaniaceae bacterium]|nr:hypothetical protein [Feifaniaceae bacterium]
MKNILNFKKPSRILLIAAAVLAAALAAVLLTNRAEYGSVKAAVSVNGNEQPLAVDSGKNPPYAPLGSVVSLQINGSFPDTITVTDIIANPDGSPKYDRRLDKELPYTVSGNTVSFTVESNPATALSSNSEDYQKGAAYRRYRVQFGWENGGEKEYALYIRTDPAILFEDASAYAPRAWLDYYLDGQLPWDGGLELTLPEYPGATFRWTPYEVTAATSDGESALLSGMPVWNVYLADLTGDGLPEFCATVSFGSGIADTRVLVYDYAGGALYELSDRMVYDYVLSLENGRLIVTQTAYGGGRLAAGDLKLTDGELTAEGMKRAIPEIENAGTDADHAALEAYRAVLRDGAEFFSLDHNKRLSLHDFLKNTEFYGVPLQAARFAVLDMDGGSAPEVVLELTADNQPEFYEILHAADGGVYGYNIVLRGLQALKADGTFHYASGAADGGYGKLRFRANACETDRLGYTESVQSDGGMAISYFIGSEPVTEETYASFAKEQDEKQDVSWYEFSPENVEATL